MLQRVGNAAHVGRLSWRDLVPTVRHGLSLGVIVMFLIATAIMLGNALTVAGVTEYLTRALTGQYIPLWAFLVIARLSLASCCPFPAWGPVGMALVWGWLCDRGGRKDCSVPRGGRHRRGRVCLLPG
ncbi:MAG: hypothetical protein H5U04_00020 [Firmicutes bacterium]|nr:hypothetical protein [Bacillota bacterium]